MKIPKTMGNMRYIVIWGQRRGGGQFVDKKNEQTCGKHILAGLPTNNGTRVT